MLLAFLASLAFAQTPSTVTITAVQADPGMPSWADQALSGRASGHGLTVDEYTLLELVYAKCPVITSQLSLCGVAVERGLISVVAAEIIPCPGKPNTACTETTTATGNFPTGSPIYQGLTRLGCLPNGNRCLIFSEPVLDKNQKLAVVLAIAEQDANGRVTNQISWFIPEGGSVMYERK